MFQIEVLKIGIGIVSAETEGINCKERLNYQEFEYANLFDGGNADWNACWRAWKSSGAWASRPWNEG